MDNHVPQNVDEIAVVMPLIPQEFQQSTVEDIFDPQTQAQVQLGAVSKFSHMNALLIGWVSVTWIISFLGVCGRDLKTCFGSLRSAFRQRTMEDILDVFAIHAHQRIVVAVVVFPQERISVWSSKWKQRTVDQLVDSAVPQEEEEVPDGITDFVPGAPW